MGWGVDEWDGAGWVGMGSVGTQRDGWGWDGMGTGWDGDGMGWGRDGVKQGLRWGRDAGYFAFHNPAGRCRSHWPSYSPPLRPPDAGRCSPAMVWDGIGGSTDLIGSGCISTQHVGTWERRRS